MRSIRIPVVLCALAALLFQGGPSAAQSAKAPPAKLRVLVVTGGHDFEPAFFDLFKVEGFDVIKVDQQATGNSFLAGDVKGFDTIVLYDMWQKISDAEFKRFTDMIEKGQGLVVLHHALADAADRPEYARALGGKFFLKPTTWDGAERPTSGYLHDVDLKVQVADTDHPVTRGIKDFDIHDETYKGYWVDPKAQVLLTTDHATSEKALAWWRVQGRSRIVSIQLGHDSKAYANPAYRRLIEQAVRFAAVREEKTALFNGKDLDGWESRGGAVWTVEDGVLVGKQGPGNAPGDLFSRAEYGDFELSVTWKAVWPANSGVWFRFITDEKTYQGDILEWKDPECWSGSIYCPGKMFITKNTDSSTVHREGWNIMGIRAQGDLLQVTLNGKKVGETRDSLVKWGKIGFQVHPGAEFGPMQIRVKELTITPLQK